MKAASNMYEQLKLASKKLTKFSEKDRVDLLNLIAEELKTQQDKILKENAKDLEIAAKNNLSSVLVDRLTLNSNRIQSMSKACQEIASQKPVLGFQGEIVKRPSGIEVRTQRIPLGMLAMVFESRPNVIIDAIALSIKSGNGLILKGGKEAHYSNHCLFDLANTLFEKKFGFKVFHYIDSREDFHFLLKQNKLIDLVIARGGSALVDYVKKEATMPVMCHDKGLCHLYIHYDAKTDWVKSVVLNAKISRPSVCNALESLLIHENYPEIQNLIKSLIESQVEVRGCLKSCALHPKVKKASAEDYSTEYLDRILTVKIVEDEVEAIDHIIQHSSGHTEGILSQDSQVIDQFIAAIDASCIVVNSSTRFNDGGELGLGAELGISTSKFHAYGPVGAEQMTTLRYVVSGQGSIRI